MFVVQKKEGIVRETSPLGGGFISHPGLALGGEKENPKIQTTQVTHRGVA